MNLLRTFNIHITLALLLSAGFLSCEGQSPVTNQHLFDTIPFMPEHYMQRTSLFKKEPVAKGGIIFLGNSITEMGKWSELFNDPSILNRGIGGDITYGVLQRLDEITERAPSKLFIMIGINDIGKDIPDAVIADNYKKIISRIQLKCPETKIHIQSILPVNPLHSGFPQHYDKETHIIEVNKQLKKISETYHCTFIDLYSIFTDSENHLTKKYTTDGLHLNEEGYKLWADYFRKMKFI